MHLYGLRFIQRTRADYSRLKKKGDLVSLIAYIGVAMAVYENIKFRCYRHPILKSVTQLRLLIRYCVPY